MERRSEARRKAGPQTATGLGDPVLARIAAAKVGQAVLEWLGSIWMVRAQIATTLLILGMGIVLTIKAASEIAAHSS